MREAPPVESVASLRAVLPSGRGVWLALDPAPARAVDASAFARTLDAADGRRMDALWRIAHALRQTAAGELRQQLTASRARRRRLARMHEDLERRTTEALREVRDGSRKQIADQREYAARLHRRRYWDQLVIASAMPLYTVFGRPQALASNNITLFMTTLIWLAGDQIVDALSPPSDAQAELVRDVDVWTYVSPLANAFTAFWLLHQRQNERFISGIASAFERVARSQGAAPRRVETYSAELDLATLVGRADAEDFVSFAPVPAVATLASVTWAPDLGPAAAVRIEDLEAVVERGVLRVTVHASAVVSVRRRRRLVEAMEIAWIADTRAPSAA